MDYYKFREKRSVTAEKMVKILQNHDTVISIEKAQKVLELIYKLSNLSVQETIKRLSDRNSTASRRRFTRHTKKKKGNENS
ncbi:hypothetical protein GCM10022289_10620 [Pedobacter jeongneungensis]|uniref:Uncharacterized protein n=1 Tax=Pedobacter jeongneungensis TaxID=947309 RepID=A0ABP8B747_9SPHI